MLGYENQSLKCKFGSRRGGEKGEVKVWDRSVTRGCQGAATSWRPWNSCRREPHTSPEEKCPAGCFGNPANPFPSCEENSNIPEMVQSPLGSPRVALPCRDAAIPKEDLSLLTRREEWQILWAAQGELQQELPQLRTIKVQAATGLFFVSKCIPLNASSP